MRFWVENGNDGMTPFNKIPIAIIHKQACKARQQVKCDHSFRLNEIGQTKEFRAQMVRDNQVNRINCVTQKKKPTVK